MQRFMVNIAFRGEGGKPNPQLRYAEGGWALLLQVLHVPHADEYIIQSSAAEYRPLSSFAHTAAPTSVYLNYLRDCTASEVSK